MLHNGQSSPIVQEEASSSSAIVLHPEALLPISRDREPLVRCSRTSNHRKIELTRHHLHLSSPTLSQPRLGIHSIEPPQQGEVPHQRCSLLSALLYDKQ